MGWVASAVLVLVFAGAPVARRMAERRRTPRRVRVVLNESHGWPPVQRLELPELELPGFELPVGAEASPTVPTGSHRRREASRSR